LNNPCYYQGDKFNAQILPDPRVGAITSADIKKNATFMPLVAIFLIVEIVTNCYYLPVKPRLSTQARSFLSSVQIET